MAGTGWGASGGLAMNRGALLLWIVLVLGPGLADAQQYRFPTTEADYANYYVTAYFDQGGQDWNCGSIYYSGHRDSDFGGGSWTGMADGRDIVAAAEGLVIDTHDGEFDQCTTADCPGGGGFGNFVRLQHPDGKQTIYGHMKMGSVVASVGDPVACGDLLGQMGSSGYSTGPHLHFDVRNIANDRLDPFEGPCGEARTFWQRQGPYDGLPRLDCADPVPECNSLDLLTCGAVRSGWNDDPGSTQDRSFYGCTSLRYTGPEVAFSFVTDRDEEVSATLDGLSADLDLYVLGSSACDGRDCITNSDQSATDPEQVTFTAQAGDVTVIVIDGWEGAVSPFELRIDCQGGYPEVPGDDDSASDTPAPLIPREQGCQCGSSRGGGASQGMGLMLIWALLVILPMRRVGRRP